MKRTFLISPSKLILFLLFLHLAPFTSLGQNIVISVTGNVLVNGQPVKKGDNISNYHKVILDDPDAELRILSELGVCVIRYKNWEQERTSELLDIIKSTIRKNSIATSTTRAWVINPSKDEQLRLVESLCTQLGVTRYNVHEMFSKYITPYCVLEFENPYWQDIAHFMSIRYGFDPPRRTGELMTAVQFKTIPFAPQFRSLTPIPSAASLKKYCPIPGDQGEYGTCTSWASAYGARTISWAVKNNLTDVHDITNQAFSPSFVYALVKDEDDYNCKFGASTIECLETLKDVGAVFITDIPYRCNPFISPYIPIAKAYAIKDFQGITAATGFVSDQPAVITMEDLIHIKKALSEKKPVIASVKSYDSFNDARGVKIWNGVTTGRYEGHAVCIIGYDDLFDNGDGTFGAVEVMNSWGPVWGDGGFMHVKYSDFLKILNYALTLYDDILPVTPPELPISSLTIQPMLSRPSQGPTPTSGLMKRMEGSLSLIVDNGTVMRIAGDESGFGNLKLTSNEKMTYHILDAYPSKTNFRINFTSSQPAYVYVISTDSKRSPLAQLFPNPDKNISALLDFTSSVSVSIPDETQYIQMDETPGEDYLCIIYSKERLNITEINNSFIKNRDKSFVTIVKEALAGQIVEDHEVVFEKNRIAFSAASPIRTAVPIFIRIKHI